MHWPLITLLVAVTAASLCDATWIRFALYRSSRCEGAPASYISISTDACVELPGYGDQGRVFARCNATHGVMEIFAHSDSSCAHPFLPLPFPLGTCTSINAREAVLVSCARAAAPFAAVVAALGVALTLLL